MFLETQPRGLQFFQVGKLVGRENLSLNHGEVNLDQVEPAGVNGRMNRNGVGIPPGQTLARSRRPFHSP